MKFVLPYPPSGNRYWRHWRGRAVLSTEAKVYRRTAGIEALRQGVKPLTGFVNVTLSVYRPIRRGDLDNSAKVLLDAMNGIAWKDDSQIIRLLLCRYDDKNNPRVEVEVEAA